ncbi:MAG: methyltransferase type 12 [Ilumatobacteraceae bacterium]|nr:methyltransferase type 12 [Ilumatobacteraceae bacterium]
MITPDDPTTDDLGPGDITPDDITPDDITPDDKDWTWVLERVCPECGFDASACDHTDVADLLRANAADWVALHAAGRIAPGRPDPQTWSSLEYACHVRDVFARFDQRLSLMLDEDDPLFPNWDQDATAEEERYDEQDPDVVIADLAANAEVITARLDTISGAQWDRTGRRSDGSNFTVASISRYLVHDPVHHLWDVSR